MIFRKVFPGSTSRMAIVDHDESYGRHILKKIIQDKHLEKCVDLGCGNGTDLSIIAEQYPNCELFGIDFGDWNSNELQKNNIKPLILDIESQALPFEDSSIDLIIANQVLEHTKEIFWINHEIFRSLKIGGYIFIGVPNLLSFHNRILMTCGFHPTQHKLISAHVRPFSKKDTFRFYQNIGSQFCQIIGFWGSQFYPFPKPLARFFSMIFPNFSFSIFFLIQKTGPYNNSFIEWPEKAGLETNFFTGKK